MSETWPARNISGSKKTVGLYLLFMIPFIMLMVMACEQAPSTAPEEITPEYRGTIVALGDSLTAGLGVAEEEAYPARLEKKLIAGGHRYKVINAGISGETSSGALSRVEWVLNLKPDIVILETGANDGLRGIEPSLIKKNIQDIIRVLKKEKVIVVLAGMRMVENMGPEYTTTFAENYADIAKEENVVFMPFFLEGVAGDDKYNQPDGIHPNSEGYRIITEKIYSYVVEAIKKLETNS
jgi:acyl-CoA thioesterase-1